MEWLLFESLLAFVILVAIVAWTMGPLRKRRTPPRPTARAQRVAAERMTPRRDASRSRAADARQCSVRGTDSVNDAIGTSNARPSSATIW